MTKELDEMKFYGLFIKFSNLISSDMIVVCVFAQLLGQSLLHTPTAGK